MVKSIVVTLDGTESSRAAQDVAARLAKEHGAALVGVGVLDVPWITAPQARPIGAGAYKERRDEALLEKGRAEIRRRLDDFHAFCDRERSEEHPSELQSLMRTSYAVFRL